MMQPQYSFSLARLRAPEARAGTNTAPHLRLLCHVFLHLSLLDLVVLILKQPIPHLLPLLIREPTLPHLLLYPDLIILFLQLVARGVSHIGPLFVRLARFSSLSELRFVIDELVLWSF